MQKVYAEHAFLCCGTFPECGFRLLIARLVYHLIHRIHKNLVGRLADKEADRQTGNRIQNREPHSRPGDTDKRANGRKRVRTVVPCIRHKRAGIDPPGLYFRVLVHRLLHDNGHNGRHQRKHAGRLQRCNIAVCNLFDRRIPDSQPRCRQNGGQYNGRHALQPLMSVRMVSVRILSWNADADDNHHSAEHIRSRVNRIGDHRPRMGKHTRQQLKSRQNSVCDNAYSGHAHRDPLKFLFLFQSPHLTFWKYVSF